MMRNIIVDGDLGEAWRTQKEFFSFWLQTAVAFAEGTPGVGHIIGALAYMAGYPETGERAMKNASRTSGVILGAAVGLFFGGPLGAAAGAVGGGLLMDLLITGVESAVKNEYSPNGYLASIDQIQKGTVLLLT
ncbi:unnamed protein product [Didymodactylos carnosus]|uniref:Uncharacterized protein n=1 Tax=Didymodactylos carnosus TaxID=1234261 RepID=A0A8S2S1F4_9BILA|nr:unnamed protein product [Didymodactylos carnosus]CAF4192753.1 unnamed protein product [Didymodactylos carnosus]